MGWGLIRTLLALHGHSACSNSQYRRQLWIDQFVIGSWAGHGDGLLRGNLKLAVLRILIEIPGAGVALITISPIVIYTAHWPVLDASFTGPRICQHPCAYPMHSGTGAVGRGRSRVIAPERSNRSYNLSSYSFLRNCIVEALDQRIGY